MGYRFGCDMAARPPLPTWPITVVGPSIRPHLRPRISFADSCGSGRALNLAIAPSVPSAVSQSIDWFVLRAGYLPTPMGRSFCDVQTSG